MITRAMNFIDGRFQAAPGRMLDNHSSITGRVSTIPRSDASDEEAATTGAAAARTGEWSRWTVEDRARLFEAVATAIEERTNEIAGIESQDTGKPLRVAASVDIPRAVANFRFFASAIRQHHDGAHEMAAAINYTLRRPVGTVGLITPWNLPLYLLTWKTAPALAMGNTIVAKPSEMTPMTATVLAETDEVGLPPGVFNLVHGLGHEAAKRRAPGAPPSRSPEGRPVPLWAWTASERFKKVSLELGGKNATVVFGDCDLERTIAGAARAGFTNQGQVCLCGSRVLVHDSIYEEFHARFVDHVRAMKVAIRPILKSAPARSSPRRTATRWRPTSTWRARKAAMWPPAEPDQTWRTVQQRGVFGANGHHGLAIDSRTATEEISARW